MTTATLTARQTLTATTVSSGATIETAGDWSPSLIPADWTRRGVLARGCRCVEPERFAFYALTDGRVAIVQFHPMNGWDALFVRVLPAALAREEWAELLEGEKFEDREYHGYGRMSVRRGRYAKAYRVA